LRVAIEIAALAAGLALLYFGAEWLVRGASRLAFMLGMRPLVIGLTVVGFGTSMPEVVVSGLASWRGQSEVALGNVLGSNIANSGLILAIAALITPLKSDLGLLRREGPLMVAVSLAAYALAWTGAIARWHGVVMLALLAAFVWLALRWARAEPPAIEAEFEEFEQQRHLLDRGHLWRQMGFVVAGLVLLVAGGHLLVTGAVALAQRLSVPEMVIAATLVAVGTSLPELATSVVAAIRKQMDISVGNIIGSNIFNLLGVLGISAAIRPLPVAAAARDFEFLWMLGFAAATALVLRTGQRISRLEGVLLLAAYAAFVILLFR
jgi:cation:H+ antiporter